MYRRNPTQACPSCGMGNKEGRDTCWKCHFELRPSGSLPVFGRALKTGLRANPDWEEEDIEDDLDEEVGHHDFAAPSHHSFKNEWAKGTFAYRRNPSHPLFMRKNPSEGPYLEEDHRRNPWLDDSSTGLSWLNDGIQEDSSPDAPEEETDEPSIAWARQNSSSECIRCGEDSPGAAYCHECQETRPSSLRRRNPWRNSVQRRYLRRMNPSSPAWMQSLYPEQGVWGRPTFKQGRKNPGRGYMKRRNPAWMQSLYPEGQGVWGSTVFNRRRNPEWMKSLYPEGQGVWGSTVFNRRRNPEWMKSLYPEGQGVWGSSVFRRYNPYDAEDEADGPATPTFRRN